MLLFNNNSVTEFLLLLLCFTFRYCFFFTLGQLKICSA